jgi:hypothetical protein
MNDRRPNNPAGPDPERGNGQANDPATPRELRGVARLLDERGAHERNRLGDDALARIFAASDLQRPLGLDPVSPIVGRIAPARSASRPFLRLAAVIAAAAGLGAVIAIAISSRGGSVPAGDELATGPETAPVVTPELVETRTPRGASGANAMIAVEHFDAALEDFDAALKGSIAAVTVSRPAGAVIVALADRSAGALAGFAPPNGAFNDELEPLFSTGALLDGSDLTYDDLSQELASVVQRTSAQR